LISDIWDAGTRGKALALFTVAPFAGPALGPIVAGFIGDNISWRWLFWVLAGLAVICEPLIIFTIPETYIPVLLVKEAQEKRLETGDSRYYAALERQDLKFMARLEQIVARPFMILFREPMLMALTVHEPYPIVFTQGHHFNGGVSVHPSAIGRHCRRNFVFSVLYPKYEDEVIRVAPRPVPPEFRLEMMLFSGPLFAISYFWFARASPISPMMRSLIVIHILLLIDGLQTLTFLIGDPCSRDC